MASFNKVILMGNLTRDPELRYLPSNLAVCEFGLAVDRRWRDKDGNMKEEVCFVDVNAFGKQAETINQYMAKGRSILIEGHLRLDTWTGQDGQKRSKHKVTIETFQFVGARGDQPGSPGGTGGAPQDRAAPPPSEGPRASAAPYASEPEPPPPAGDDIPF
jgi:single-strand DNA-binding protein